MAACCGTISIFLLSYLLLFSSSSVRFSSASRNFPYDSDKVAVGVYYESLCPYSANFIVTYLVKYFEFDLASIADLHLVPWGNAKIGGNNTFSCQHGPFECFLNTVEACAIHAWPDLNKHFPFIYCIESLVHEHKYRQWESCFEELGLDPKPVTDCYNGRLGKELELQYAVETNALQPPHKYVPWVVVDGQPLYEDYENVVSYICKAYKGTAEPKVCTETSINTTRERKADNVHPVSYNEERAIPVLSARLRSAITLWMKRMNMAAAI